MPLDWIISMWIWSGLNFFLQTLLILFIYFPDGFTVGSVKSNCMLRMASFGDDVRPCDDFCPSGTDVSLILKFIWTQFLPKSCQGAAGGGYLFCGFPLLLPAQVPGGCALWWLTAINSSSRGYPCQGAHLGGRCWWHVLLCGCSLFSFWRERGEEEESAHWVSRDPAGARVGRWWVDKLWGSVHWVMKWRFRGKNVKNRGECEGPARDWHCN